MMKIINADLYKSFHRTYLYVMMACLAGMAILFNAILASQKAPLEATFELTVNFLTIPLFFLSMFADVITAEENKEHTLKNTVSFGFSRAQLFLGKSVSTILVMVAVASVTLFAYFASAFLLLQPQNNDLYPVLSNYAVRIGTAFLIYVASVILATLLAAFFKRNALFTFAYLGCLFVPVFLSKLLGLVNPVFSKADAYLLANQTDRIGAIAQNQLINSVWVALAHIAVFTVLGLFMFRRQEVN
ncbi:MAG: ABC transporter permease subunit [Clostridiales bacterium]|nr:ABC transporter permease subunit [Clostridiales bacterium]